MSFKNKIGTKFHHTAQQRRLLGSLTLLFIHGVLCECEAIVNSRPLTYLSEISDYVALTPAMFMQDIKSIGVSENDEIEVNSLKI